MTLQALKEEIEHLSEEQRLDLLRWLDQKEQARWDAEIERDFGPDGRGRFLLDEAKADLENGRFKSLDKVLADNSTEPTSRS